MPSGRAGSDPIRLALVAALNDARIESGRAQRAYASPYSSHDTEVEFHSARGFTHGIASAIEVYDKEIEADRAGAGWHQFDWNGTPAWKRSWIDGNGVPMEERRLDPPVVSGVAASDESSTSGPDSTRQGNGAGKPARPADTST